MAANTLPIFPAAPKFSNGLLTGNIANTKSDGAGTVGTTMTKCFTTGTNGSYISRIRITGVASAASTTMTATTIRLYISTTSSGTTAGADTVCFQEIAVDAKVADHATNGTNYVEIPCDFILPTGYYIHASIHANLAASSSWNVMVFGGDY